MEKKKEKRKPVDWEAVETQYRAGIRSLKDIGAEFNVSAPAIVQRAKKNDWARDLSAKIKQAAENKVNAKLVNAEVNAARVINDRQIVDANATMLADKVINQREDVRRARSVVNKLWTSIEAEVEHNDDFAKLGAMLRNEDEFGQDTLNDIYHAAISLPQKVKSVKLLADAIKVLIELERKILRIDTMPDGSEAGKAIGEGIAKGMSDASKAFRDELMAELAGCDD